MTRSLKQSLWTVFKIALPLGLIYFLVAKKALDFESFMQLMNLNFVLSGLFLMFIGIFINNFRWLLLLRQQGFDLSLKKSFELTLIGIFFNFATPGGVGGDVVKGIYLVRGRSQGRTRAFLTILVDRIIGLYTMMFFALFFAWIQIDFLWSSPFLKIVISGLASAFVIATVCLALAFTVGDRLANAIATLGRHTLIKKLSELFAALHSYGRSPGVLAVSFLLSVASQTSQLMIIPIVGALLGSSIELIGYMFVVPLGVISTIVSIVPAGVGVGQTAMYYLFEAYQPGSGSVGTLGITSIQIYTFAWGLVGAVLFMRMRKSNPKVLAEKPVEEMRA